MIFSRFRNKSPWQSKDSNTRISAINNGLDINLTDQKVILLSLLAEDKSELVRRAVLLKFNDFAIWQQASENNDNNKIRDYAVKEVAAILLNERELTLSNDEKLAYIHAQTKLSFLEAWLKVENDSTIVIELYKKIAKPQLSLTVFKSHPQTDVQQFLVDQATTIDALEKLLKKSTLSNISSIINDKISTIKTQQEKPIKLVKQAQLTLAKLLALKDVSDYQTVVIKQIELEQQWRSLTDDFNCLEEEQQLTLINKYQDITQQLAKIFATKAEAFEQQKIANALVIEKEQVKDKIALSIQQHEHNLSDSIFKSNQIDEDEFISQLRLLQEEISESVLSDTEKKTFKSNVELIENKLSKLPEIAESLTEATHLISKISQISVPNSLTQLLEQETSYQHWLEQWHHVSKKSNGSLPESIVNSYQDIVKQWNSALKPLHQQQKQNFHLVQRKLSDFNRLASSGKFNACFGVFKKIKTGYEQLNTQQKQRIQRDIDSAQEKINELSDWEHYISTPRKQALLEQMNLLVETPLDNPSEQAAKVRAYRNQWNSLGHAEDDVEQALNEQFNLACEQAFAPCRLFYAEQDKIRSNHLSNRLAILEETQNFTVKFNQSDVNWKSIDAKVNQLKQKWRDAGEVDRDKYKELNEQFNGLLKPIKLAIHQHHQENINAKQILIKQVQQALVNDDIQTAVNDVKKIQVQWRDIGYSGPKDENKLWQQFRSINDQVFDRRNIEQNKQKEEYTQLANEYFDSISEIEKGVLADKNVKSIKAGIEDLQHQKKQLVQETAPIKPVLNKIEALINSFENELSVFEQQARNKTWQLVFLSLADSIENNAIHTSKYFQELPMSWQKKLTNLSSQESDFKQRLNKTIALEIMGKVDSPDEDKQQRLAIQIELMQSHMSSGEQFNLETCFFDWLNLGQLKDQDLILLNRVKSVLLK
jgi:DNA repair protein SbcC/Rad50